jgi:hypothetical protein
MSSDYTITVTDMLAITLEKAFIPDNMDSLTVLLQLLFVTYTILIKGEL